MQKDIKQDAALRTFIIQQEVKTAYFLFMFRILLFMERLSKTLLPCDITAVHAMIAYK